MDSGQRHTPPESHLAAPCSVPMETAYAAAPGAMWRYRKRAGPGRSACPCHSMITPRGARARAKKRSRSTACSGLWEANGFVRSLRVQETRAALAPSISSAWRWAEWPCVAVWLEDRPWAHHSSFPLPCGKQTPQATDNALGLPGCNKILLETPKPSEVGSSPLEVQIKTVVILLRPKKCKDVEGRQQTPRWEAFPTSCELWLHLEAARACCCRQGSGGVRFLKELRLT